MAQAKYYDGASESVSTRDVDLAPLGDKVRARLLRSAVIRYQANLRQGTHSTKTRAEVSRTGRKPFRQKGTGRARAGDFASPLWKGGGTVFGPRPRSHRLGMTAKGRREALKSAVLSKFADNEAAFLDKVSWEQPSAKRAHGILKSLEALDGGAVIVLGSQNETLFKSFRNLRWVEVVPAQDVNAHHILSRRHLVMVDDAYEVMSRRWNADSKETGDAQ